MNGPQPWQIGAEPAAAGCNRDELVLSWKQPAATVTIFSLADRDRPGLGTQIDGRPRPAAANGHRCHALMSMSYGAPAGRVIWVFTPKTPN
jgi:hypothetical protein